MRFNRNGTKLNVMEQEYECECEIDWNCYLHSNRAGTWIETRFQEAIHDEARAFGYDPITDMRL